MMARSTPRPVSQWLKPNPDFVYSSDQRFGLHRQWHTLGAVWMAVDFLDMQVGTWPSLKAAKEACEARKVPPVAWGHKDLPGWSPVEVKR